MPVKRPQLVALTFWAACAVVTGTVVFDRQVYLSSVRYTQQQIQRHERGEQVSSIEEAFMPELAAAARSASLWGGAVLAAGIALTMAVTRRTRKS
jgi:hypothetical protein